MLHTHLHIHVTLTRGTNGRSPHSFTAVSGHSETGKALRQTSNFLVFSPALKGWQNCILSRSVAVHVTQHQRPARQLIITPPPPWPEVMSCKVHYIIVCLITPFSVGFALMKIITGPMERNTGVCACVACRILYIINNVIWISSSEIHAKFSSQYLKVGDHFENVGVDKIILYAS
jgi:hypothetical protein